MNSFGSGKSAATSWKDIRLPAIQAGFFGSVLGISGLGTNWRLAASIWGLPAEIGEALHLLAVGMQGREAS
jgi:tellurite resistance protein